MRPLISIIYVYFNTPKELDISIKSIKEAIGKFLYEIIIADNNSQVPLSSKIKNVEKIHLIKNKKNVGYGPAINQAEKVAKGEFLLLVNPDTKFSPKSIELLLNRIEKNKKVGVISPKMISEVQKSEQGISGFPFLLDALFAFSFLNKVFPSNPFSERFYLHKIDRNKEQEVPVVSGACMLVRREVFKKIKGFDERFFMYFEESDFCYRVKEAGYKVLYYPKAEINHYIGKSTQDTDWIEKKFEESRFKFFRKYHGLLLASIAELFLRATKSLNLILFLIIFVSLFLNLYELNRLMMFIGDFGRDYLAARDMLLTGKVPLVGIPSSVVWLHQGPLSIYLVAITFILGNFNPVAPTILYGLIGVFSTVFVYILGKTFFNKYVGLLASIFFATSPLIVINARMPYHTSPIPFFACLFFYLLYHLLNKKIFLMPLFFSFGLLLQLELSNSVLIFVLILLWILYKIDIQKKDIIKGILGFLLGITPLILYDLTHGFIYTLGFPLWVINRIRLFLGFTLSDNSTTWQIPKAIFTIWQNMAGIIFPASQILVFIIFVAILVILTGRRLLDRNNKSIILVLAWIGIPLIAFVIHAAPGSAYFPLVFPPLALLLGFCFYTAIKKYKIFILLASIIVIFNATFLVKNKYFLTTEDAVRVFPPGREGFGITWSLLDDAANFIVNDAKGRNLQIRGGGYLSVFVSGVDHYKYLVWWRNGTINDRATLVYTIFEEKKDVPQDQKVIYYNKRIFVTRSERNNE